MVIVIVFVFFNHCEYKILYGARNRKDFLLVNDR